MNDNILNAGISVRDHALQKHNKVFVQRMDVRFPLELQQKAIIKYNKRFIEKERNDVLKRAFLDIYDHFLFAFPS